MSNENFKIVEINGVKMQVDLRTAKVVDEYKVGDNIKVLVSDYGDNFKSYVGTIIGFDNYENHPTIVIAYLKTDYATAEIKFLYYNSLTKDAEICPLNEWDMPLKKSDVLNYFRAEQEKKKNELSELEKKQRVFEQLFGKYFEKQTV
jgi:hypothetical protein